MSKTTGSPIISSLADLFAAAYQIEADAAERYELLATQMETHNNPELASLFRDLARAEGSTDSGSAVVSAVRGFAGSERLSVCAPGDMWTCRHSERT